MEKLKVALLCGMMALCMTSCGRKENTNIEKDYENLQAQYESLQKDVQELEEYKTSLQDMINEEDVKTYVVTFEISQSHITLDIGTWVKDAMNTTEIEVMVDKRYYDSVEVGQSISNDFRIGSFLMKGSVGSWDIEVSDKEIR